MLLALASKHLSLDVEQEDSKNIVDFIKKNLKSIALYTFSYPLYALIPDPTSIISVEGQRETQRSPLVHAL